MIMPRIDPLKPREPGNCVDCGKLLKALKESEIIDMEYEKPHYAEDWHWITKDQAQCAVCYLCAFNLRFSVQ